LPIPEPDTWRHLFGPEGGPAPFTVRNRIDCFDCRARSGASIPFPAAQGERDIYFYVFDGSVEVNGQRFGEGEQGLWLGGEALEFAAREDTLLVAFLIDPGATVVRLGTVGDHPAIPRPWLAPLVRLLLATRPVSRSRP
jgi:redox-sensitive bicupin YhaK (pirin superfamily)